jgi:hypothetical protein
MAEKSAMQKSPGKKRQANPERIQRRLEYLRGANPDDPRIAKLEKRLEKAGGMPEEPVVPFGEATAQQFQGLSSPEQIGQLQTGAGQNIQSYLQQLQAQGAFQPGEYEDTYQQAYQNVMGQFESQTAPEFARQNEAVEAAIAQRGIDPTGTQAQRLREQAYQNQAQARQQAMYQAEQMGVDCNNSDSNKNLHSIKCRQRSCKHCRATTLGNWDKWKHSDNASLKRNNNRNKGHYNVS